MHHPSYAKADLVLLAVTLAAAGGWVFSREALSALPPLYFIGTRFLLAGAILFWLARSDWPQLGRGRSALKMLGTGFIFALALLAWVNGLAYGGHMGEGAFITVSAVVIVPLMAWLLFRERAALSTWIALPVALLGLACLSLPHGFRFDPGQWYFLTATLLFALHFTVVGRLAFALPTLLLTAIQLLMVGVVGVSASFFLESWPESVSLTIWGWFLASVLIATCLRFGLQIFGQSLAPASHVALILILEPVWTASLGVLLYDESMVLMQVVGCCLIFAAILIGRWHLIAAVFRTAQQSEAP